RGVRSSVLRCPTGRPHRGWNPIDRASITSSAVQSDELVDGAAPAGEVGASCPVGFVEVGGGAGDAFGGEPVLGGVVQACCHGVHGTAGGAASGCFTAAR